MGPPLKCSISLDMILESVSINKSFINCNNTLDNHFINRKHQNEWARGDEARKEREDLKWRFCWMYHSSSGSLKSRYRLVFRHGGCHIILILFLYFYQILFEPERRHWLSLKVGTSVKGGKITPNLGKATPLLRQITSPFGPTEYYIKVC
jgi:hypothetical protein